MPTFVYQFCVFKSGESRTFEFYPHFHHNSYNVVVDEPLTTADLSSYATQFVFAERCLTNSKTNFYRVVAFEVRENQPFDHNTKTHTMMCLSVDPIKGQSYIKGFRPGAHLDDFVGVSFVRNRVEGRREKSFFPGTIGGGDLGETLSTEFKRNWVTLSARGPLARWHFPFYSHLIEQLPGTGVALEVDRFGVAVEGKPFVGTRRLGHVSHNLRMRKWHDQPSYQGYFVSRLLHNATQEVLEGLQVYDAQMRGFQHRWGDGETPQLKTTIIALTRAASTWLPLANALGYSIPEDYAQVETDWTNIVEFDVNVPRGSLRIKQAHQEVLGCVQQLFSAQQYLMTHWIASGADRFELMGRPFAYPLINERLVRVAREIYDEFDALSACFFKIADVLNVLQQIIIVTNKRVPAPHNTGTRGHSWLEARPPAPAGNYDLHLTPFEALFPYDPDPFWTSERTEEVAVVPFGPPPDEEVFNLDRDWERDEDDENMQLSLNAQFELAAQRLRALFRLSTYQNALADWWNAPDDVPDDIDHSPI